MDGIVVLLIILLLSFCCFIFGIRCGKNGLFYDGLLIIDDSDSEKTKVIVNINDDLNKIKNKKIIQLRVAISKELSSRNFQSSL